MSLPFLVPGTERACTEPVPDGAVRLDALHNLSMAEGRPVWRYEPGHPMAVVFTTTVEPGDLEDSTLCEQVFMLLDVGHAPDDVERPEEPDPRALAYRERGNRGPMVGDAVAVTRAGAETAYYAVAWRGFEQIDPPSLVTRSGMGTVALT
ncbi:MAG TPA: hypothetical protein VL551_27640 [Actinospica sp.]|jgi:hypothetical protein|nr:hypothetical protein [Actinospica sp.]